MAALLPHFYPVIDHISDIDAPLLLICGEEDEFIPVDHGRRLFAAASAPKGLQLVAGRHHNDTYVVGGTTYLNRLPRFIESSIFA